MFILITYNWMRMYGLGLWDKGYHIDIKILKYNKWILASLMSGYNVRLYGIQKELIKIC